jgi:hypothetical protein
MKKNSANQCETRGDERKAKRKQLSGETLNDRRDGRRGENIIVHLGGGERKPSGVRLVRCEENDLLFY